MMIERRGVSITPFLFHRRYSPKYEKKRILTEKKPKPEESKLKSASSDERPKSKPRPRDVDSPSPK